MVIVLLVIALVLGISYCCYWVAFYNPERRHTEPVPLPKNWRSGTDGEKLRMLHRQMCQLPGENISITSHDGLTLGGRYYHMQDGAPLQIQFHGYRGCGERDLCGLHRLARDMGHNTLVVSQTPKKKRYVLPRRVQCVNICRFHKVRNIFLHNHY